MNATIRKTIQTSVVVGVASLSGLLHAQINPAVEYTGGELLNDTRPFTLGYEFSLSQSYTLNALGYFQDDFGYSHQVGIWDTAGNLLVSTTVTPGDSTVGHFQWQSIPNFVLSAGTYVIGGEFPGTGNESFPAQPATVTTIPGYTWVTDLYAGGGGLNFPTSTTEGTYGDNGILAVDFSVGQGVPDAGSTLALLGGAFAGIAALRRKIAK